MSELRSIEIDFDVHKCIELERRTFQETPNEVLRRLLGIDKKSRSLGVSTGRPWSGKGVTLPHGTDVRMEYNGRLHIGTIHDGEWLVEGKRFKSPSAAAGGVATTKLGKHPSLDGWEYWQVKRPGDHDWVPISELRKTQLEQLLSQ